MIPPVQEDRSNTPCTSQGKAVTYWPNRSAGKVSLLNGCFTFFPLKGAYLLARVLTPLSPGYHLKHHTWMSVSSPGLKIVCFNAKIPVHCDSGIGQSLLSILLCWSENEVTHQSLSWWYCNPPGRFLAKESLPWWDPNSPLLGEVLSVYFFWPLDLMLERVLLSSFFIFVGRPFLILRDVFRSSAVFLDTVPPFLHLNQWVLSWA